MVMEHSNTDDVWIYSGQDKEVPATVRRVKIAANVTAIPDEAFASHQKLEEVTLLSSSVQEIGKRAFSWCRKLKSILYQGLEKEEVGISSNVRVIDECAFTGCKLIAGLGLNEGLERIGREAFNKCESLTEVDIPSTVKVIDDFAFSGCNLLARLVLNEGLERIGSHAFCDCKSLIEVESPSTVKMIDNGAFSGCILMAGLGLNEGLERIGGSAFLVCESLTEVEIPSTVKVIGGSTFFRCRLLARLVLNEGLERIGGLAFCQCDCLTEVEFPSTVKVIDGAFSGCKLLAKLGLNEGLERIGNNSFLSCESLMQVEIPSTVKVISDWAFLGCRLLARLVLNEGLEQIGELAFCQCDCLTEVEIPSTVKVIDSSAFSECKLLAGIGLNEGLERICETAFRKCVSLSRVRIPQSVNIIATDAFDECSSIISIELPEECSYNIELSGCLSLVSVVGPISITTKSWEVEIREAFFQSSKLGSLVDDEDDLKRKLNHRFDNSPLNKLCYYQSYESLDVAMAELRSLMEDDPLAATEEVDGFGMTPLHVLSLSQTVNLDMLLAVMDAGKSGHMVRVRDSFGSTPMEYLCMNRMPNSSDVIRRVVQDRFEQVLGGMDKFWKSAMMQAIDEALAGDWSLRKSEIGRVVRMFEPKEILSLLELCLWKMKIDETTSNKKVKIGEATSKKQQILADRQRCRVMSGADFVIPQVLAFLGSN